MLRLFEFARGIPVERRGRWYATILAVLMVASAHGAITQGEALLYGGVASAVLGNGLAVICATNGRRWLYGIALAVQPVVVYLGLTSESQASLWVGLVAAVLGVGTAAATTIPWSPWSVDDEPQPAASSGVTTDRSDPRLTHGVDTSPTGQAEAYLVINEDSRADLVRPVRTRYRHEVCGAVTTMARDIAETYAAKPDFYGATYCVGCHMHRPVSEFVWDDDGSKVGS